MQARSGGRVTGVDAVRGVAALAVFVCHLSAYWITDPLLPFPFRQLAASGAHGVDLFVVISGFCLALPALDRGMRVDKQVFWKRRAMRLLPPYWVALVIAFVLAVVPLTTALVVPEPATVGQFLLYVVTLQTWVPSAVGSINGSLWSISLEAHLYIVFPLVLLAWRRFGPLAVLIGAAALSLMWSMTGTGTGSLLGSDLVLPARLVQFVAGMWCAQLLRSGRVPRTRVLLVVVGVFGGVALVCSSADVRLATEVLWAIPCAALVLLAATMGHDAPIGLASRFGAVSFSFYLVHQPALLLLAGPARSVTTSPFLLVVLGMTAGLLVVLAVAVCFFNMIERPSHGWSRRVAAPLGPGVAGSRTTTGPDGR